MVSWKDDVDVRGERRIYDEDVLCDGCDTWQIPIAHDEEGEVYCIYCIEKIAEWFRNIAPPLTGKGVLFAGEDVIFDVEKKIDKVSETIDKYRIKEEIRQEYKRNKYQHI
ncbi:MAG: hypothetical protein ACE5HR_00220 [bacterium]